MMGLEKERGRVAAVGGERGRRPLRDDNRGNWALRHSVEASVCLSVCLRMGTSRDVGGRTARMAKI